MAYARDNYRDRGRERQRSRSRERPEDKGPTPHRKVINTIEGGFGGGGASSSSRRRYLRRIRTVNTVTPALGMPPITFTDEDFKAIDAEQNDPMVISVEIANYIVRKTLIDQGSSADILYWKTFKELELAKDLLMPFHKPLVGFSGEKVNSKGCIDLYTKFSFDEKDFRLLKSDISWSMPTHHIISY